MEQTTGSSQAQGSSQGASPGATAGQQVHPEGHFGSPWAVDGKQQPAHCCF